jgi:GDPmannose 4,6-dehydratase
LSKRAIICGISGQDGAYLAQFLLKKGYAIWGTSRDAEMAGFANLKRLGIKNDIQLISLNLRDVSGIINLLARVAPDEIYNLAAQSSVGLSFEQPYETFESIVLGGLSLLEAIRLSQQPIRFYNAGSTECFGDTGLTPVSEISPFNPRSPYAIAKAATHWTVGTYREAYRLYACTGVLSNHDSPLRPRRFVTRKIVRAVAELSQGNTEKLRLGSLDIERDWGWAPDYVDAIWRILQQDSAEDFIVATGVTATLEQFVEAAYHCVGRNWRDHVLIDSQLYRPTDIIHSRMNPSKAETLLGWRAKHTMIDVVRLMFEEEVRRVKSGD